MDDPFLFRNDPVAEAWHRWTSKEARAMAHYQFESEWTLTAPVDRVFELASHPESFTGWWPHVTSSRLVEEGDENGVGSRAAYTLRSPFWYSMNFVTTMVDIDHPRRIHMLVRGDLIGTGTFLLDGDHRRTRVRLIWNVSTTKPWMNLLAPVAGPLFGWAHNHVTRAGAFAMARRLDATLLSTANGSRRGAGNDGVAEEMSDATGGS